MHYRLSWCFLGGGAFSASRPPFFLGFCPRFEGGGLAGLSHGYPHAFACGDCRLTCPRSIKVLLLSVPGGFPWAAPCGLSRVDLIRAWQDGATAEGVCRVPASPAVSLFPRPLPLPLVGGGKGGGKSGSQHWRSPSLLRGGGRSLVLVRGRTGAVGFSGFIPFFSLPILFLGLEGGWSPVSPPALERSA